MSRVKTLHCHIDDAEKNDGGEFSKIDQSIALTAPGQTATKTTQGGSNI